VTAVSAGREGGEVKDLYIEGKQYVPDGVKTGVQGLPGCFVYQASGANAWVKSYEDGTLLLGSLGPGETWTVFTEPKGEVGE
jgi:hypothetical protein